jgi:hypothetical protein
MLKHRKDVAMQTPRDLKAPPGGTLSGDELAAETAVDLPEREAMSTFGHGFGHGLDSGIDNLAMPINESTAANIESNSSIAAADAEQTVIIYQVSDD